MIVVRDIIKIIVSQNHYNSYIVLKFTLECKAICERVRKARRIEQKYKRQLNDEVKKTQIAKRRLKMLRHVKKRLIVKTLRQSYRDLVKKTMGDIKRV